MDVSHGLMTDMRKHKKTIKQQHEEYPQPPQIAIVCIIGQIETPTIRIIRTITVSKISQIN